MDDNEEIYTKLDNSAKAWTDEQIKVIDRRLLVFYILMALSVIIPMSSILMRPGTEGLDTWFQRSGAIMVVLSLYAEIKLNEIGNLAIKQDHTFLYCHMYLKSKYNKKLKISNYCVFAFVSIATIVWGYGDVLLKATMQ